MSEAGFELPGLQLPGSPTWRHAGPTTMQSEDGATVLDLAMAFGSELFGHGHQRAVLAAWQSDATVPAPGLGDLYSHSLREAAVRRLCRWAAGDWGGVDGEDGLSAVVLHTGSEAVETALKTAILATGRDRVVAFEGAYHGTFGLALAVTHRREFREPFAAMYGSSVDFCPYGEVTQLPDDTACVIVEPVQGRAGVIAPPDGFLSALRRECDRVGALLVLDDVLVACGRLGSELLPGTRVGPDIVCLGKALGGGVPSSAVIMRREVADRAWGGISGEAIHTSTGIGEPLACAAVLETVRRLQDNVFELDAASDLWRMALTTVAHELGLGLRGEGLLWALDTGEPGAGFRLSQDLLGAGVLVVPSGSAGESITVYPSLAHGPADAEQLAGALREVR